MTNPAASALSKRGFGGGHLEQRESGQCSTKTTGPASRRKAGPRGDLVWLFIQGNPVPGSTEASDLVVATTTGGTWGPDYNPDDVEIVVWGTGYLAFPTCKEGSVILTPNAEMAAMGYTEIAYDINRDLLEPGIDCPTFVNNDEEVLAAK